MTSYRPRLWFGLGLSVLVAGPGLPALAASDPACLVPPLMPGGEGEGGERGGEGAVTTPETRALLLDRMAAQITGAAEARAAGDAGSADILVGAATDEGPARLARRGGGADAVLEARLAPLAAAPGDAAAASAALAAVEAALAAVPGAATQAARLERAAGLAALALDAFADAQDCGRLVDGAAYAEARALVRRALLLLRNDRRRPAREMAGHLGRVAGLLPVVPPEPLPAGTDLSVLISKAVLAASDGGR